MTLFEEDKKMEDEMYDNDGELHGTSKDEIIDGLANLIIDEEQYDYFPSEMWKFVGNTVRQFASMGH